MEQNNEVVENTTTVKDTPKTFDEVLNDKEYQREFDRRVNKALETAKSKWQEEADAKRTEAEKLASMKEAERSAYELEKANKEKMEAIAKLNAYQLKDQAIKIANEKGVSSELLSLIDFNTIKAEDVEKTINNIKSIIDNNVEKVVNDKLKENTPKTVVGGTKTTTNMPEFF